MFLYDEGSLRIVAANEASLSKYGYTSREFRSMTICDLRPCGDARDTARPKSPLTFALDARRQNRKAVFSRGPPSSVGLGTAQPLYDVCH